jgi:hypothetical protein
LFKGGFFVDIITSRFHIERRLSFYTSVYDFLS